METQEAVRTSHESPAPIGLERVPESDLRRQLLEMLLTPEEARQIARQKMTYEEFLAWANEDTLAEWVDGEVVMYSPASRRHQSIAGFLTSVMRSFVEQHDLGIVLNAPFQMKLEHGREPDLLFVASGHLARLKETYLDGPADLVIEIISPESVARDRGTKFYEYAQGGVAEYWLIDPQVEWIEFYRLGEVGFYETVFSGREGVCHSEALPGFWLRVEWLWQKPLPAVEDVLLEVGGETYARRWIERLRQRGFLPSSD
ncbi:MAG: Uma2 family endonuclease [Chloroflexota bacterium]|nr:Uma2 family endonuclease [Chloroflexota bacterium]